MRKCMTLVFILAEVKDAFLTIELPKANNEMPSKIAEQYPGYSLILHYDNATKRELDLFLNNGYNFIPVILLVNYDEFQNFQRPTGYKFVSIVYLLDPFLFEAFSNGKFNLEYSDVVIFVTREFYVLNNTKARFEVTYIWNQKGLDQSGCVILYDICTNDFYYVHFYVGTMTGVLNKIPVKNNVPRLLDYMNEFQDFNGHNFNVAFYPYAPFIYCGQLDTVKYDCNVEGIDGKVLKFLSRYLNFRFHMKNSAALRSGGEWRAMIEDVHFKRMDWAVGGISRTLERMQLADFTSMMHMESYTALFVGHSEEMLVEWNNVLLPFQILVWLCLAVIIFCMGVLIRTAISTVHSRSLEFIDYFRIPFHAVVEQTIPRLKNNIGIVKLIVAGWFLVAIIITTAYKSKLASSMIRTRTTDPNSILELYEKGYTFHVNKEDWTVLKESLQEAVDVRYQRILEKSMDNLEFCPAVLNIMGQEMTIIDEETPMQYIVTTQCGKLLTPLQLSKFRMVKQKLFPSIHGWPMQLGSPYRYKFSKIFQRLLAAGILDYWYEEFTTKPILKSNTYVKDSGTASSLTVSTFLGPAFILLVGTALAFVVFLSELVYFKYLT